MLAKTSRSRLAKLNAVKRRADDLDLAIGRRVHAQRLECGFSQTALADRIGVSIAAMRSVRHVEARAMSREISGWRPWFAWRPVCVAQISTESDPWRIWNDTIPHKIVWFDRVWRRPIRSISEQRQPLSMFVYRPSEPRRSLADAT